jgi:nucleoside-triphosphatase THEP1
VKGENMSRRRIWSFQEVLDQVDVISILLVAGISSILGFFGVPSLSILEGLILGLLAIIGFAMMRDRFVRDKLSKRLDQLENNVVLDNFFQHDTDEKPLLQDADDEIWLVRQTGNFTFDLDTRLLEQFLERNKEGYIRIVLTAPTEAMLNQVALRNNLTIDTIDASFNLSRDRVRVIKNRIASRTKRLQVRFVPYPIQMNSIFVDPYHSKTDKRQAVIRYIGYNENVDDLRDMLDFTLRGDLGPGVFSYYFEEAQKIFLRSSKVVILTGLPRSGKTRTMQGLINSVPEADRDKLFSILSPRSANGGFEVIVNAEAPRTSVERQDGKDDVKLDVLKDVTNRLAAARGKILIVDDVRSYHLQCEEFIRTIKHLMDSLHVTLFLTLTLEERTHPGYEKIRSFVNEVEHHYRTTVLNEERWSDRERRLQQELEASLLLVKHAPDWGILPDS